MLSERFGFLHEDEAACWVTAGLDVLWGIQVDACQRTVMSDRNALAWVSTASGPMLAKWCVSEERFPRLAALARLTSWLDDRGLPVPAPVAALDGRVQVEGDGASLSVQRVVTGEHLDTTDFEHVREAGAVLARLHIALAQYPHADQMTELLSSPAPLASQVTWWLDHAPDHVPAAVIERLRRLVAHAPAVARPSQLVHGDFRSANVLCTGSDVAAVIDFEEARRDQPIAELARSAVLLGTRFHDWGPVSFEVHRAFLDGYREVRELTWAEAKWWLVLLLWYSVLMIPAGEDPTGWEPAAVRLLHDIEQGA
ncbi:phosphotransferase [Nocardioides sp. MAHUQ-72]|uniref:phosphotransferase n=1 Tax=unclassified Nocardioides TaxID=2615069 RepID=UPI003623AE11